MDKIFQKICNAFPHYKLDTFLKKKVFYFVFSIIKFFLKGPFVLTYKNFKFFAYPQKKDYSRSLLTKINLHDESEINFLINNIDNNSILLDCGANQGFYSIPIAGSHRNCEIFAFEPSEQEIHLLKKNIKLNDFNNITPLKIAIAEKEGNFKFKNDNIEFHSTKGGFIIDKNENDESNTSLVKTTTIDKFIQEKNIPKNKKIFIKIDLEGYDINAIYGSKDVLNEYFTIILFEFSKMAIKNSIYNIESFQNFLIDNNLLILDINLRKLTLLDLHKKIDALEKKLDVLGNFLILKEKNYTLLKI